METYITKQGDTWDIIAFHVYGPGFENQAGEIMKANPRLLDYFQFKEGVEVKIPALLDDTSDLPPWRQ